MKVLLLLALFALSLFSENIEVGVRPYYLTSTLEASALKEKLSSCNKKVFKKSDFVIAHRGAPFRYAEHTKESYEAAIRMGAGILECDVTSTKDNELVCRHSVCDLDTTTNILLTPLATKCTQNFIPYDVSTNTPASATCCTTDITLQEFYSLKGKMDKSNPKALDVESFVAMDDAGTLMSHKDSIKLFKRHNVKMIPEVKISDTKLIDKLIQEYKDLHVDDSDVYIQSFHLNDILYIIKKYPSFAQKAVYLQEEFDHDFKKDIQQLASLKEKGVVTIAPPIWALLTLDSQDNIVPSLYAKALKKYGFKITVWSLERSEMNPRTRGGWYYQSIAKLISKNSDILKILHILDKEVGVQGVFSDWSATVTFYKNCIK